MAQDLLILHLIGGIILPAIPPSPATQSVQHSLTHDSSLVSIFMLAKGMVSFCFSLPSFVSQQEAPQTHPSTCGPGSYQLHIPSVLCPTCSNPALRSPTQLTNTGTALGP